MNFAAESTVIHLSRLREIPNRLEFLGVSLRSECRCALCGHESDLTRDFYYLETRSKRIICELCLIGTKEVPTPLRWREEKSKVGFKPTPFSEIRSLVQARDTDALATLTFEESEAYDVSYITSQLSHAEVARITRVSHGLPHRSFLLSEMMKLLLDAPSHRVGFFVCGARIHEVLLGRKEDDLRLIALMREIIIEHIEGLIDALGRESRSMYMSGTPIPYFVGELVLSRFVHRYRTNPTGQKKMLSSLLTDIPEESWRATAEERLARAMARGILLGAVSWYDSIFSPDDWDQMSSHQRHKRLMSITQDFVQVSGWFYLMEACVNNNIPDIWELWEHVGTSFERRYIEELGLGRKQTESGSPPKTRKAWLPPPPDFSFI